MKPNALLLGVAALLIAMVAAAAYRELGGQEEGEGGSGDGGRSVPVQTAEIRAHPFADTVEAIGTVRAGESVAISSNVADTVTSIGFVSGETVSAGAELLTLSDAEERAALADAELALSEARREAERLEQVSDDGAVSRSELDRVRSVLQRAEAQVDVVRARLDDHVIRAPFDGRVGLRDVSVGAYVSPGEVLLTLDQMDDVDLDFTVPERFLAVLEPGQSVRATATAYPDDAFEGSVTDIDSRVDPITRAVTVRARLPNSDGRLRPGMLLAVELRRDERQSPAVPEVAVMRDGEQVSVFGIEESEEGDRAVRRSVRLGVRDGALIEVLDGLSPGDVIISKGMHRATEGDTLEVKGTLAEENASDGQESGEGGSGQSGVGGGDS